MRFIRSMILANWKKKKKTLMGPTWPTALPQLSLSVGKEEEEVAWE